MTTESLAQSLVLPELKIIKAVNCTRSGVIELRAVKTSPMEVCPRCATPSYTTYDRRWVRIRDEPVRAKRVVVRIHKRRFDCRTCRKPFTEPVPGIKKGARTTERFKKAILWACERFANLKAVRETYRCSGGFVYDALYTQLELKRRTKVCPWPKIVGIDEHAFRKNKKLGRTEFVSMVVDYNRRRLLEVVEGKTGAQLEAGLNDIQGRDNVRWVVMDMCDAFKSFAKNYFKNASFVADKFHVLRLLNPAIMRKRAEITGNRRSAQLRRLLLRSGKKLDPLERGRLQRWLDQHPELNELYHYKEALHGFYRIRGYKRAAKALTAMTDRMALSAMAEITKLRKTLMRWRKEILAYFKDRLTNARTEGFNNKAKVVKRRAYGYKSFKNYRLRLLHACS